MKKFLDRYVFGRTGLQVLLSIGVVVLFSVFANMCRDWFVGVSEEGPVQHALWGFKQVSSPAMAIRSIESVDDVVSGRGSEPGAAGVLLFISLGAWFVGLVLYSFVTGAIVNAFRNRKQKIDSGLVRYRFRDHGVVIGWDFQGPSCVRKMLEDCHEVLVVSSVPAEEIRNGLDRVLAPTLRQRVFVYNGDIADDGNLLRDSRPELARRIAIFGERDAADNDGGNLYIERLLRRHIADHRDPGLPPVDVRLHLANPVLHAQALSMSDKGFAENDSRVDLDVFNYAESWAWKCWSEPGSSDCSGAAYLPLRHKPDAERVELFVIGGSMTGLAMARFALPLLNYGADGKRNKVTIFGCPPENRPFLPERRTLDDLPETEVTFSDADGISDEANATMLAAAGDPGTAVTIVVAPEGADAAIQTYAGLAASLRRLDISILVWMPTSSERCPEKPFLQSGGDRAKLRFFGMTDVLPWMEPSRHAAGAAVNWFYGVASGKDAACLLPPASDPHFVAAAKTIWNPVAAEDRWKGLERWRKWSSINCSDAFKERSTAFPDFEKVSDIRIRLLRAEHNRWWTERLLAGWEPCPKPADKNEERSAKASFRHWNLVLFDELDDFTKELDRVPLAAMVVCGIGS